jgi:hypothetical protein
VAYAKSAWNMTKVRTRGSLPRNPHSCASAVATKYNLNLITLAVACIISNLNAAYACNISIDMHENLKNPAGYISVNFRQLLY